MVTLDEVKLHLRIEHDEEDQALAAMLEASTDAAADYLGGEMPDPMPAPVRAAILLQVGDLYLNRERQGDVAYYQNRTYERLLNPYRSMGL